MEYFRSSSKCREDFFDSIKKGDGKDFIQNLLELEEDIDASHEDGYTLLCYATVYGDQDIIQCLIEKGADCNVKSSNGSKPLHIAAELGYKDIVEVFLEAEVPIDDLDGNNLTPLQYAAKKGHEALVMFLLEKGATFDEIDLSPFCPVQISCCGAIMGPVLPFDHYKRFEEQRKTVLFYALVNGWLGVIQFLSNKGVDFDKKIAWNQIPLMVAVTKHKKDIVQFLIEWGVNLDCTDPLLQWTVLHSASYNRWSDIVQSVLERGANVNEETYDKETPLLLACSFEHRRNATDQITDCLEVLDILLDRGADINACNFEGETALHSIIYPLVHNKPLLIKVLNYFLKRGADCNKQNNHGKSPFDHLLFHNDIECIKLMIENGGYITGSYAVSMSNDSSFKENILQNIEICTWSIINKYNNKDLPSLYKYDNLVDNLPSMEKIKITGKKGMIQNIENTVRCEIQAKGFCNLFEFIPITLSTLAIKSALSYCQTQHNSSEILDFDLKMLYECLGIDINLH